MSVFSPRRPLFLTLMLLLLATAASAITPSARYDAKMVYDPVTTHSILFGGATANDVATKQPYEFSDTWDWNGQLWTQLFPLHVPTARYGHIMVYDSKRDRIVMFGGRSGNNKQDLNDTWVFKNGDWTQINTANAPPVRVLAGAAYDPIRDRVVLFGGATITSDNKTTTRLHDTWEFDGNDWTQVIADANGPAIDKPQMVWDVPRNHILMLGVDTNIATHQLRYDPDTPQWNDLTANIPVPTCVNEGAMVYQTRNDTIFFTGGSCSGSSSVEDDLEWDGNVWNVIGVKNNVGRVFGQAMTYDAARQQVLLFGGNPVAANAPRNELWTYNGDWNSITDPNITPPARSLFAFRTDPSTGAIWLFAGVDPYTTYSDLWKYQYGTWEFIPTTTAAPTNCGSPSSAFDTDRNKLVVVCADTNTLEFDLTDWKVFTDFKSSPQQRAWSSLDYDANLKKSVLFGGYTTDYINDTWMWDGTTWTQQSHNLPPARALAAIWFDPHTNRTVIFGGIGRPSKNDRTTRFNDMWSFDGNGWTQLTPSTLPPPRYGAQVAVDPSTGNTLLFGGVRVDTIQTTAADGTPTTTDVQVYANDFWQWDGTNWTQMNFPRTPYARENGGMAFDPSTNQLVIFGGYAGEQYLSDLWTLTPDKGWQPFITNVIKRRSAGRP